MGWARRVPPWLAFVVLLGVTAATYYPGLYGPFMLDDWANLPALGAWGPVNNPTTLVSYLTSGIAGPGGRPLALATFLLDARNWPANPWPFKFTNLLLHLLNGALLAALLARLSRWRGLGPEAARWAGVLAAGLWVAHPLFVSTTLYVIQRMSEIAVLFVFAGLLAYTSGRTRLTAGRWRSGYALMGSGLLLGSLLGALAKENALLLPLFALVLEFTMFQEPLHGSPSSGRPSRSCAADRKDGFLPRPQAGNADKRESRDREPTRFPDGAKRATRGWFAFRLAFLWLPSLALAGYLLAPLVHATDPIAGRNFTIATRLMTEARVLAHYLYLLVIPHARTGGLFSDIMISTGPLSPWTTLPCILLVGVLVVFAFGVRRRLPALAAAILFYFAGQSLESTTVPLELCFEHRNYLPAALAFWPFALWTVRGPGGKPLRAGAAGLALAVLLALTALRAGLWGHGGQLALAWLQQDPNSARAQVWGAQGFEAAGRPDLALATLRHASRTRPGNISIALSRLETACSLRNAQADDLAAVVYAARHADGGSGLLYKNVERLATRIGRHPCPPLDPAGLLAIPAAALANPHFADNRTLHQEFLVLRGQLLLRENRGENAYRSFARALRLDPRPDTALVIAADLYAAQRPRPGLAILEEFERLPPRRERGWTMGHLHQWWLTRSGWYRKSFRRVRGALEEQARRSAAHKS